MTVARKELFMHIGGPCDGTMMLVDVDEHDVPVELNMVHDFTTPNPSIRPGSALQSQLLTSTYEREEILGDEGFAYQFRFRGTDMTDQSAAGRKAA